MKVGTEYYFYHNDHLGTPQKITTVSGAVVWSAKYSSFGKAEIDPASTVTSNLRFPGQYFDQETGLYYNWYRFYDPTIGRYIKKDPIGFRGGDINLYGYGLNCPTNRIDNTGKFVRTVGCNERQKLRINVAVNRIEKNILSKCICDENAKAMFKASLSQLTVTCADWEGGRNPYTGYPICGYAQGMFEQITRYKGLRKGPYNPDEVILTTLGIDEAPGCGALEATLLEEIAHNWGYDHEDKDFQDMINCAEKQAK
ncbi:MAG: RHS repeat domain-containing protein [Thermodesulfobacteriota bacterium]